MPGPGEKHLVHGVIKIVDLIRCSCSWPDCFENQHSFHFPPLPKSSSNLSINPSPLQSGPVTGDPFTEALLSRECSLVSDEMLVSLVVFDFVKIDVTSSHEASFSGADSALANWLLPVQKTNSNKVNNSFGISFPSLY